MQVILTVIFLKPKEFKDKKIENYFKRNMAVMIWHTEVSRRNQTIILILEMNLDFVINKNK